MKILSMDFGTSSVKMAIIDEKMNIIKSSKVEYLYKVIDNDKVELSPNIIIMSMIEGLKAFNEYKNEVELIGFCTFSPSVIFMDKEGTPLYPIITHLDRRSIKEAQKVLEIMGEERFHSITGVLPFAGGTSITTILWMMENDPRMFNKTYMLGHMNTWIYKRLTGCWAIDSTNASMMGIYETIKQSGWSEEILSLFDIPQTKLPNIYKAGKILGRLSKEMAQLMGLKQGIPVALGSNDAATAQIGADNSIPGDMLNISGSSEMISIISNQPVVDKKYYLRNAATPGLWQIFSINIGGFAIEWFRKQSYREMDREHFYNSYLHCLIGDGLDAGTVRFMPYLAGDRQSLERKRGSFTGLTLDTTREDMLAAILLGINVHMLDTIEKGNKFLDISRQLKITGGLANEAILTLKRSIFKDYDLIIKNDCTLIGSARLALEGIENLEICNKLQ